MYTTQLSGIGEAILHYFCHTFVFPWSLSSDFLFLLVVWFLISLSGFWYGCSFYTPVSLYVDTDQFWGSRVVGKGHTQSHFYGEYVLATHVDLPLDKGVFNGIKVRELWAT